MVSPEGEANVVLARKDVQTLRKATEWVAILVE